jgi:hypothetical protein
MTAFLAALLKIFSPKQWFWHKEVFHILIPNGKSSNYLPIRLSIAY